MGTGRGRTMGGIQASPWSAGRIPGLMNPGMLPGAQGQGGSTFGASHGSTPQGTMPLFGGASVNPLTGQSMPSNGNLNSGADNGGLPSTFGAMQPWSGETGGPTAPDGPVTASMADPAVQGLAQAMGIAAGLAAPGLAGVPGTIASGLNALGIQGMVAVPNVGINNQQSTNNVTNDVETAISAIAAAPDVQGVQMGKSAISGVGMSPASNMGLTMGLAADSGGPGAGVADAADSGGVAGESSGDADYAKGGVVHGPGDGNDDKIPIRVSDGEGIIPANMLKALGGGSPERGYGILHALIRRRLSGVA